MPTPAQPFGGKAANNVAPEPDAEALQRALTVFPDQQHGVEIRVLPSRRSRTFAASDHVAMIGHVGRIDNYRGIFYTVNPVSSDLEGAAKNADVLRRRWLFLDIDAVKGEPDGNATDSEHTAARVLADRIVEHLDGIGWPQPVIVDSGNGWHLFYRVDLPVDAASDALMERTTDSLATRFNTPLAKVDGSVHNAGRIARLPGTWARKGPHTPERPHRLCKIVSCPDVPRVVPPEMLAALGVVTATPIATIATPTVPYIPESSPTPMTARFRGTTPAISNQDLAYARSALFGEADAVKSAPEGQRNNALNTAAFKVAQFIPLGLLTRGEVEGILRDAASVAGLGLVETAGTIHSGIEAGIKAGIETPRQLPSATNPPPPNTNGKHKGRRDAAQEQQQPTQWEVIVNGVSSLVDSPVDLVHVRSAPIRPKIELWTVPGLLKMEMPPVNWVVPGILSEGLNILAGKPKQGKSMLALNLGMTVAAGGMALGDIQTTPGDVLYLSLEDKQRRIHARASKMLKGLKMRSGSGVLPSTRLQIATLWPRQDAGGVNAIRWWARNVERPSLVIIDVWGRFKTASKQGNQYEQDYEHMGEVKQAVDEIACSSMVLHHCKKGASDDVLEEISGTMGLSGAADGSIVLTRSRNDNDAKIFITGRDTPELELALRFDPETLTWTSLGNADQHVQGKLQAAILAYLRTVSEKGAFSNDIAAAINASPDSVRSVLHRMHDKRLIKRVGKAWAYPADEDRGADEDVAW